MSVSRIPVVLPPVTWILLLACISPAICASVWRSGSRMNDVVRMEQGPKLNMPSAIREALSGRSWEDEALPREAEQIPAYSDSNKESEATSSSEWETVLDPRFYILTEWETPADSSSQGIRSKRHANPSPSLSIVNPLDVLRQRLLFEIARRRQKQSHTQIMANNEILRNIGRK